MAITASQPIAPKSAISFFVMCAISTSIVFALFLLLTNSSIINDRARMDMLVRGDAHRPFVYRALLPWLSQLVSLLTPTALREAVTTPMLNSEFFQRAFTIYHINIAFLYEELALVFISYLFFLAFPYAFRYLLTGVYKASDRISNLLSVVSPLFLAPLLLYNYVYDFSQLTLFTLALALMLRRRWGVYLLVFAVGCLNKETTLFLLIPFLLYFRTRLDAKSLWQLLGAQLVIWTIIKLALQYLYRNNPGDIIEYHLWEHFPRYLEVMHDSPVTNLFYIVFIGLVAWLVFHRYREQSLFLMLSSVMVIPIAILYFLFGTPYEVRVFYEAYPCLTLMCMFQLGRWRGWGITVIEPIQAVNIRK